MVFHFNYMADLNEGSNQQIPKEENKPAELKDPTEKVEKQAEEAKIANTVEEEGKQEDDKDKDDDDKSIYIKNVDYNTEPKELEAHFAQCGKIEKVTIVCDKYNGHPLGYDVFI